MSSRHWRKALVGLLLINLFLLIFIDLGTCLFVFFFFFTSGYHMEIDKKN